MTAVFSVSNAAALEQFLRKVWALSRALPNALVGRFEQAVVAISATEREATVRQRVGQNLFREGLMTLWGGRCAITGLDVPELLRASHAKPWADSNDVERLDVYNGLLLAAHWDAAFDVGLVTVQPDGRIILLSQARPNLGAEAEALLEADDAATALDRLRRQPTLEQAAALRWAGAASRARISLLSGLEDQVVEDLFATPLQDGRQVQRLLDAGGTCLFLDDAHKALVVVKE